ncbi:LLM class flavin-dependent oxidoreductase [Geodermatophilus aquaeductus]|uniref:FMN-dependent oxidoreductase, nitrilotriacetate monooxygenase family n=1 Tax=Geodermatophilus aquaeductus TaxID=1564161 RepID=A0A521FSG0_9ACTN|nr:NtaA/DmoA family FMN-dependent monooxygenase [Geodermatophilus aquaeductus]SMO99079.1 FMN-dependent oxidoreductase, nitrilotriacetate monooxygenase family [Geodermatophilus aquaeductus]
MTTPQMLLAIQIANGYGAQPGAWRMPGVDPSGYTDMDVLVRHAQAAERGKIQLVFLADTPALTVDLEREAPQMAVDPLVVLTSMARGTERIGLVATASTTLNEPYTIARQFKALDVASHGRAGWNAVPTSSPAAAANHGLALPPRAEKYERAHEVVQIVQALWGSWERAAWVRDVAGGRFADTSKIRPVDLQGRHVASRGPLPIPPSEQGQPVVFQAGGGGNGLEVAARYASGVYANPFSIEEGRAHRTALRAAAERVGRDPDEVELFAGFMPSVASSRRAALDRRRRLDEVVDLDQRVTYLGAMLGLRLGAEQLDEPLTDQQLAAARPSPGDPRAPHTLEIAREGWSLRDVLAHGVIDYHPVVPGTAADVADHMQQWFEAGACDGFSLAIDVHADGIDAFVDQVVPLLQERGLFHRDYEGATLRDHLGAPDQYGLDPRLAGAAHASS